MRKPDPVLFLDDHRGIYIPRDFARCIKRECLIGVSDEDLAILENPDHEHYWDVWADVCDKAKVIEHHDDLAPSNPAHRATIYHLYQDGALWLVPHGMEWSEETDWYVWPGATDDDT